MLPYMIIWKRSSIGEDSFTAQTLVISSASCGGTTKAPPSQWCPSLGQRLSPEPTRTKEGYVKEALQREVAQVNGCLSAMRLNRCPPSGDSPSCPSLFKGDSIQNPHYHNTPKKGMMCWYARSLLITSKEWPMIGSTLISSSEEKEAKWIASRFHQEVQDGEG